jgi:hypothetical protein
VTELSDRVTLNTTGDFKNAYIVIDMSAPFTDTFELQLNDVLNTLKISIEITVNPTPPPAIPFNAGPTFVDDPSQTPYNVESSWQQFNDLKTLQGVSEPTEIQQADISNLENQLSTSIRLPQITDEEGDTPYRVVLTSDYPTVFSGSATSIEVNMLNFYDL